MKILEDHLRRFWIQGREFLQRLRVGDRANTDLHASAFVDLPNSCGRADEL